MTPANGTTFWDVHIQVINWPSTFLLHMCAHYMYALHIAQSHGRCCLKTSFLSLMPQYQAPGDYGTCEYYHLIASLH